VKTLVEKCSFLGFYAFKPSAILGAALWKHGNAVKTLVRNANFLLLSPVPYLFPTLWFPTLSPVPYIMEAFAVLTL